MSTAEDWNEETYVLSEDEDGASPKKRFFKPQHRISPIKSFLHHKKLAALTVVLVAVAAEPVLYYRAVRPIYRAESVLAVAPIMLKNVIEDREYQLPRYDEVVNEQISLLTREEVTLAALEQLKSDSSLWIRPEEGRRDAALRVSAALQARRVPDSTYISVALESGSPAGLSQVVNAVVAAYLAQIRGRGIYGQEVKEETLQERRQELREAVRKRVEQLAQWSKELGVANFEKAPEPPAAENKVVFDARARLLEAVAKHEALKVRHEAQLQSDLTAEARELLPTDPEVLSM